MHLCRDIEKNIICFMLHVEKGAVDIYLVIQKIMKYYFFNIRHHDDVEITCIDKCHIKSIVKIKAQLLSFVHIKFRYSTVVELIMGTSNRTQMRYKYRTHQAHECNNILAFNSLIMSMLCQRILSGEGEPCVLNLFYEKYIHVCNFYNFSK